MHLSGKVQRRATTPFLRSSCDTAASTVVLKGSLAWGRAWGLENSAVVWKGSGKGYLWGWWVCPLNQYYGSIMRRRHCGHRSSSRRHSRTVAWDEPWAGRQSGLEPHPPSALPLMSCLASDKQVNSSGSQLSLLQNGNSLTVSKGCWDG